MLLGVGGVQGGLSAGPGGCVSGMVCAPPPPGSLRTHSLPHAVCQGHGDRCLLSRLSHLTGIFSRASRAVRLQPTQLNPTEEVLVLGWTAARFYAAARTSGSLGDSLEYTKSASVFISCLVLIKVQSSGQMHGFGSAMIQHDFDLIQPPCAERRDPERVPIHRCSKRDR